MYWEKQCFAACLASVQMLVTQYLLNNSSWIVQPSNPNELAHKLHQLLSLPESERVFLKNCCKTYQNGIFN